MSFRDNCREFLLAIRQLCYDSKFKIEIKAIYVYVLSVVNKRRYEMKNGMVVIC